MTNDGDGELLTGQHVDVEQFAADLSAIADEVAEGVAVVESATTTHETEAESVERVSVTVTFNPSRYSTFQGGYTIPHDT